ncbi:hypothetical protein SAMN05443287_111147 [Micromonospora phaseoli]|uniref:Uncharacterized protein n=1 Tax=Micromonospora phaseoli TaxID=1144548 RepID=A0A1H7D2E9_9ACTN|nr:hypothetical protein [Micromonospora phaseoli]PZV98132.1 hypothetical protein CLV64_105400 [Micromonospora phaseoli]GIJ77757.1 hypothetical protein Xph01_21890 [Micromonospora phaseoli]SEJ95931.1 hypothetical protein SAMN05443287_111147 [Micromonospora phaseoli]
MRAGDLLRQLDQRLLPRLASAVVGLGQSPARVPLIGWVATLSCAAVLATAVLTTGGPPVPDRTVGEVTRVGVVDGDSIVGYEQQAAADLAALAGGGLLGGGTYALVSLTEYLTPQSLAAVVGDVGVAVVFGRVPLPERQTEIVRIPAQRVPEDVTAGMAKLAERKEREAAEYRSRATALGGGGPQERELRQLYTSGAQVADAEAAAYRAGCACLYAMVVRAAPAKLRGVAARPGVRVVDPAPEVRRLERTVFSPPLPEQRDVVRPPVDREPTAEPTPSSTTSPLAPVPLPVPGERSPAPEVTDSSPSPAASSPSPSGTTSWTPSTSADTVEEDDLSPTP